MSTTISDIIEITIKNSSSAVDIAPTFNEVVSLAKQDLSRLESLQLLHSAFRYCLSKTRFVNECASDASLVASCCDHPDNVGVRVVALLLNKVCVAADNHV